MKQRFRFLIFGAALGLAFWARAGERGLPRPLPAHPGNVFVAGERVIVAAPPGPGDTWRALDYEGKAVAEGVVKDGRADLGALPAGYYEVMRGEGRVSAGVLAALRAPTPLRSPLGVDVALAWLLPKEAAAGAASLCALAGMNRVQIGRAHV